MEDLARPRFGLVDSGDRAARLGRAGIALRRPSPRSARRRSRSVGGAASASSPSAQASISSSRSLSSRIISTWHSGSPKRTLYSTSFGPLGGQHQPGVEHARIGRARVGQRARRSGGRSRPSPALRAPGVKIGGRAVGAHAAGIGAGIAVADALVVLRRAERDDGLAVDQGEEADLLAVMNSSITTRRPAPPKPPSNIASSAASRLRARSRR